MSHKRASTFRRRARRGNHSYWRWVRGSNPWPLQWQCNALAWTELTHQKRTGILIRSFPNNRQLTYEHGGCHPTFDGERKEMKMNYYLYLRSSRIILPRTLPLSLPFAIRRASLFSRDNFLICLNIFLNLSFVSYIYIIARFFNFFKFPYLSAVR